jgi:hypothetical protein
MFRRFQVTATYRSGKAIYTTHQGYEVPPDANSIQIQNFHSWLGTRDRPTVHWLAVGRPAEFVDMVRPPGIQAALPEFVHISRLSTVAEWSKYCAHAERPAR